MKDLSKLLIDAKHKKLYANRPEFEFIVNKIENLKLYKLDWDRDAGEDWARFMNADSEIVVMLNAEIGVVFLRRKFVSPEVIGICKELFVVDVESFCSEEWYADVTRMKRDLPEICWRASEEAVNTEKMSLQDLYYATV